MMLSLFYFRMGAGERAGSGSPFTPMSYSDDREASDSDKDVVEKKRKKNNNNNNGGYASGNGSSSTKENGDYTAPSLSKVRNKSQRKVYRRHERTTKQPT